ncbi:hypothetical protein ECZU29_53400 [Escherichia coli]|nr:hypothetical protein ECZU29_53400 [Escherichia coli]
MRRLTDAKNRRAFWQKPRNDRGNGPPHSGRSTTEAQARSDTALDRLMQGAPAPLAAGNLASDTNKELLNTPEALPV